MKYTFDTPMTGICFPAKLRPPGDAVVAVVKATLDIVPDGVATLSDEQFEVSPAEELFEDEIGNSCYYPGDFVPMKPRTDLLLIGTCFAPKPRVRRVDVAFQVASWYKKLVVFGARRWGVRRGTGEAVMGEPEVIDSLPIRYEYAHGDPADELNPYGSSMDKEYDKEGRLIWHLPNIENPDNLIAHINDKPPPAGYGPLSQFLPSRIRKRGTYNEIWMRRRRPYPPDDIDWSCYNAAPDDQQYPGYLLGDEPMRFFNMHREHPQLVTRLPGLQPHCFVHFQTAERRIWSNMPLQLDTLWVNLDLMKIVLVWRSRKPIPKERDDAADACFIYHKEAGEPLDDREAAWLRYQSVLHPPKEEKPEPPGAEAKQKKIDAILTKMLDKLKAQGAPQEKLDTLAEIKDPKAFEKMMINWGKPGWPGGPA